MFAKLNHVALISDNYGAQSIFYKALFDLKTGSSAKFESTAIAIGGLSRCAVGEGRKTVVTREYSPMASGGLEGSEGVFASWPKR